MADEKLAKIIAMAAFAALLVPACFAQANWDSPLGNADDFTLFYTQWKGAQNNASWVGMAMLAIAACIAANALLLIIAKALNLPDIERFAYSEFYHTTASAMMIVFLALAISFVFSFLATTNILPSGSTTECAGVSLDVWGEGPFSIIQCKLQDKIIYSEELFNRAYESNIGPEIMASACTYAYGMPIWCGDWDEAVHTQMEKAHYIANRVVPIAISLHAQYMFVDYLANNMMAIFLPLGILLRIFPPLRGIGGLFIGIAIGFYLVLPVTYILLDPTTSKPDPSGLIPVEKTNTDACYQSFSGFVTLNTQSNLLGANSATTPQVDINQVGAELTSLQIESFFNPLAALAATILFINAIVPALGGDTGNMLHFISKTV